MELMHIPGTSPHARRGCWRAATGWAVVLWASGLWSCASRMAREDCEPAGQFAAVEHEERRVVKVSTSAQPQGLVAAQALAFIPPERESCPNWKPALELARYKAGCETGALSQEQCACRRSFPRNCDLCYMLEEGAYPAARFDLYQSSGEYDPELRLVRFRPEHCTDSGGIEEFASTMLHEAVHACEGILGRRVGPTHNEAAYWVENQCFGKPVPYPYNLWNSKGGGR